MSNPSMVSAVSEHHDTKTLHENKLQIISMTMQQGEEIIVGQRLRSILDKARKSAKA
jgi:L-seryl-tRNA(Ser) seleniumtransferase